MGESTLKTIIPLRRWTSNFKDDQRLYMHYHFKSQKAITHRVKFEYSNLKNNNNKGEDNSSMRCQ